MANVTINAIRVLNRVNLTTSEITAEKVEEKLEDSITTIEEETGHSIGELSGSPGSKSIIVNKKFAPAITDLAAIYCIVDMTGGKAVGLSFSLGDVRIDALDHAPPIQILERRVSRAIKRLKKNYFGQSAATGWMA